MSGQYREITSEPSAEDRERVEVMVYVDDQALAGRETVPIRCECNTVTDYSTASRTNVCECMGCGKTIGISGITGGPGNLSIRSANGDTNIVPIQGFDEG